MRFAVGCRLNYRVARTPASFLLNIQPARLERQKLLGERLSLTPELPVESHVMPESGNRYLRFEAPPGELAVDYRAEVEVEPERADPAAIAEVPPARLPFETLPHLLPSRYCESDRLPRAAIEDFGGLPPGHLKVTGICNWINEQVEYLRGTSDVHTSACDTLIDRAGVCRDFAHLGIALCRSLGIPARYASAYAWRLAPPDFHGLFEAYLDGRWWWFDATRQAPLDGLVRIGVGRDASDVAFATIHGEVEALPPSVEIERTDGDSPARATVQAISTSDA
jgi:transglutaminase-like putative cysteine protease